MADTTTTKTCRGCQAEVEVEALRCVHCAEWLLSSVPTPPAASTPDPGVAQAPAPSKPQWPRIVAIVLGAVLAGFMAIVILLVLAIAFLGEKPKAEFKSVGEPISAPAPPNTPRPALNLD